MQLAIGALGAVLLLSGAVLTASPVAVSVAVPALLLAPGLRAFPWERAVRMWWRMKWFYLSLALFFGLWPLGGGTAAGLLEAATRIVALMLVVLAVVWLTDRYARTELVPALGSVLGGRRGSALGAGHSFARRLFLALEAFERDRAGIEAWRGRLSGDRRARVDAVREWLVQRLDAALDPAEPEQSVPGSPVPMPVRQDRWRGVETGWMALVGMVALGLQWGGWVTG
ncbi:hypothetical protein [Thioalkalivibrio sp. ALR17-21]|uniref:hypothetical protein n=1 Tax=Thioalkalivibrio sp. ALR17-21 TaxID=1269813 RepID=UPI0003FAFE14|nr:hypothetical protein [Thioalkalivibrio sp. ALR17-21]